MSTAAPNTFQFQAHEAQEDKINGSILNVASIIKNVVASAAKSEVGACFHNAQSGAPLRVTLTEMGHTQTPDASANR
jgi:hypothetical protein